MTAFCTGESGFCWCFVLLFVVGFYLGRGGGGGAGGGGAALRGGGGGKRTDWQHDNFGQQPGVCCVCGGGGVNQ